MSNRRASGMPDAALWALCGPSCNSRGPTSVRPTRPRSDCSANVRQRHPPTLDGWLYRRSAYTRGAASTAGDLPSRFETPARDDLGERSWPRFVRRCWTCVDQKRLRWQIVLGKVGLSVTPARFLTLRKRGAGNIAYPVPLRFSDRINHCRAVINWLDGLCVFRSDPGDLAAPVRCSGLAPVRDREPAEPGANNSAGLWVPRGRGGHSVLAP